MNRVSVTIAQQQYTLLTDGEAESTRKVAEAVDGRITQLLEEGKLSLVDAAILTAMNLAEDYFKEQEGSDNLRRQLKEYLEENTKLKLELSESKRKIFALEGKK